MGSIKCTFIVLVIVGLVGTIESSNHMAAHVSITVLKNAVAKGAVCLDGSSPAYHLERGSGSGAHSWLVHLEGGGWCSDIPTCSERAHSALGSSLYMGNATTFTGVLSGLLSENPGLRNNMVSALTPLSKPRGRGLFINSCYAHCQTTVQALWNSPHSPKLNSKTIAEAAGDWFFDRSVVSDIDCPYPSDSTCNNKFYN